MRERRVKFVILVGKIQFPDMNGPGSALNMLVLIGEPAQRFGDHRRGTARLSGWSDAPRCPDRQRTRAAERKKKPFFVFHRSLLPQHRPYRFDSSLIRRIRPAFLSALTTFRGSRLTWHISRLVPIQK